MEKISEHISYREATFSNTAIKKGIQNIPSDDQLRNMQILAEAIFEPLRAALGGRMIRISSFFRCDTLNKTVGGSDTSQHLANNGAAIDLDNDNNREIFDYIKNNLIFDQLIWEYGTDDEPDWVHVSYHSGHNRNEILRAINGHYIKI